MSTTSRARAVEQIRHALSRQYGLDADAADALIAATFDWDVALTRVGQYYRELVAETAERTRRAVTGGQAADLALDNAMDEVFRDRGHQWLAAVYSYEYTVEGHDADAAMDLAMAAIATDVMAWQTTGRLAREP